MQSMLILRLFCAIFLVLLGGLFMITNSVTVERVLGAVFAGTGLTALYIVWLGTKSR